MRRWRRRCRGRWHDVGGPAAFSLPLSPCGRGWRARSDSEREPGEGSASSDRSTPHPPSLGFASARAPSPARGEGKRDCRSAEILMSALWTLDAMASAMRADKSGALPAEVPGLSIDSRSIGRGEAFFAIQGDNRDGHDFVEAALKAGAGLAVIARAQRTRFAAEAPLLAVDDVLGALRDLARAARARSQRQSRCRHRLGRQDRHQRGAQAGALRRRRNARVHGLLQQSLGRAAVSRAVSDERQICRLRNRHEPCRRNHAAHAIGAPARRHRHRDRAGASGIFRFAGKDRRRQGGNLCRAGAERRRRAQPRQRAVCPPCRRRQGGRRQTYRFVRRERKGRYAADAFCVECRMLDGRGAHSWHSR